MCQMKINFIKVNKDNAKNNSFTLFQVDWITRHFVFQGITYR